MVKRKRDKLWLKLYHFKYEHVKRGFKIEATYDDLMKKLQVTNGYCTICDKHVGIYKLTGDMINPSRKKVHSIDDIQFICRVCNSAKHVKDSFVSIGFIIEDQRISWYYPQNPCRVYTIDNNRFRWSPFFSNIYKRNICLIFHDSDYAKLRVEAMNWKKYPKNLSWNERD